MKEHLRQLVAEAAPGAVNLVREYLQARILGGLQRGGAMVPLAFQGGTCLRFVFGAPRFSEDLDFALEGEPRRYDLRGALRTVQRELEAEGYAPEIKVADRRAVHSALIRFAGLLHELGLSPRASQVLSVKVEVDTRPPRGAGLTTTVVRRHQLVLQLQHHDRASLLAGKLHALLARPFTKGRDLHDLLWYLSDRAWPAPNLALLAAALEQSAWRGPRVTAASWRRVVAARIAELDWSDVLRDVRPFLERDEDLAALTRPNLLGLLGRRARGRGDAG